MTVRLPSGKAYEAQIQKESRWLPYLQKHLPYAVSAPIAVGQPGCGYPYMWSVNRWIEGETLLEDTAVPKKGLARDLASALRELQAAGCAGGPRGGAHNFYRGCTLDTYHRDTVEALGRLQDTVPAAFLRRQWEDAMETAYQGADVWVHGDIAPGNILVRRHRFYGLIDFGILGTGDPACDYAMAWSYFDRESRAVFLDGLAQDMVARAKGWALWKALITYHDANPDFRNTARTTLQAIMEEA